MMSSPLLLEQLARLHQETYQREAAADRLTLQLTTRWRRARAPIAMAVRARLSAWLYALAARLASDTSDLPSCSAEGATIRAG